MAGELLPIGPRPKLVASFDPPDAVARFEEWRAAHADHLAAIPPDAREGRLTSFDNGIEDYSLELGHLDPLTKDSGIRARLTNLGLDCGDNDESLAQAIMEFQQQRGLDATGEMDDATRTKLKKVYGS